MMRDLMFITVLMFLAACTAIPDSAGPFYQEEAGDEPAKAQEVKYDEQAVKPVDDEKEDKGRPVIIDILLYVPNRVLDALDIVRAGVSVGPGIGVDLTATEALNATLMTKASKPVVQPLCKTTRVARIQGTTLPSLVTCTRLQRAAMSWYTS